MNISKPSQTDEFNLPALTAWATAVELAWKRVRESGDVLGHADNAQQMRTSLAEYIVAVGRGGEMDVGRLADGGLAHLQTARSIF
jgi:hypothetical protein